MLRSIFLVTLLAPTVAIAVAETWHVGEGSEAVFHSRAPLESFDGRTQHVGGHISVDPDDLTGPLDMTIEVDLASLDTGISKRNRQMREQHLETDEYPLAVFTGTTVVAASAPTLIPGESVRLTVAGAFALHGVTRAIEVEAEVTLTTDGLLTAVASFPVKLSDHDIDRPRFLLLRLADEQQVEIMLVARRAGP
jgi:polyisoprenoid-binding protein YceI